MRRFGIVLAICLGALTARADDVTARAEAMLSAGVDTVVPVQRFAALGPDVVPALIAIFEREGGPRHVRLRALEMLTRLDDARATAWLERLVQSAARNPTSERFENSGLVLRRALAGLLARPQSELVLTIAPLEQHRDARVRKAVAQLRDRSARRSSLRLVRPESAPPPR